MTSAKAFPPLYRRVLGEDFDRLPAEVKRLHDHPGRLCAAGLCRIRRGEGLASRIVARLFGLPPSGENLPVTVCFIAEGGDELWDRDFGGHRLRTRQGDLTGRPGLLYEAFGPGHFVIRPRIVPGGLELELCGASFLGLPLPGLFWPRIRGREGVEAGRFTFDVSIALPVIGLLVAYSGFLIPREQADEAAIERGQP